MNVHWEWKIIFTFMLETKTLSMCVCVLSHVSCVRLSATLWTVACQAPLSMGLSRQEYWRGLLCPPKGLPDPGVSLLRWQAGSLLLAPPGDSQNTVHMTITSYDMQTFFQVSQQVFLSVCHGRETGKTWISEPLQRQS